MIKFSTDEEKIIIKELNEKSPFKKPSRYDTVWKLTGMHSPCVHDAVPELNKAIKMQKLNNKKVEFACLTVEDAKTASEAINSKLQKYGYKSENKDNLVIFETSDDTSVIPFLNQFELDILYCEHNPPYETVFFVDKKNKKPRNLFTLLKEREEALIKKYNEDIFLPKKPKRIRGDFYLPDISAYSPKFLSFIIETKPTFQKVCTLITLYHLADLGIPFHLVDKWNLIRIINKYAEISEQTIKHQFENEVPISHHLATIYSAAELNHNLHEKLFSSNKVLKNNTELENEVVDNFIANSKEAKIRPTNVDNKLRLQ